MLATIFPAPSNRRRHSSCGVIVSVGLLVIAVVAVRLSFPGLERDVTPPTQPAEPTTGGTSGLAPATEVGAATPEAIDAEDAIDQPHESEAQPTARPAHALAPVPVLEWTETGHDPELEAASKALLTVTVFEGDRRFRSANHPVRVEPLVFRPGRAVSPELRTDAEGRVRVEVPAGEALRVLVLEEHRNVTKVEERLGALAPGTEGTLDVTVPLPPLDSMWVRVVDDATDAPVEDARVWIERLLRIDGEPFSEVFVEARTDRDGRALLTWPRAPALGARAEKPEVGEARFVPVDRRGTPAEPFEVRLGDLPVRGAPR